DPVFRLNRGRPSWSPPGWYGAGSFNVPGGVRLDVVGGAGQRDDTDFDRECRELIALGEAAHLCFLVSWDGEADIDGRAGVRRLAWGCGNSNDAGASSEARPIDSCRRLDLRAGEAGALQGGSLALHAPRP